MLTRKLAVIAILIISGELPASEPPKLDAKTAESKLKKLREAVGRSDEKPYSASQWEEVRDKNPDWKKENEQFDKITDGLSEVVSAAKKLVDTISKDAGSRGGEVKRFFAVIEDKKTTPNRSIESLEKLFKAVDTCPAGLVGESTDAKFQLTVDELLKDQKRTIERMKSWLAAMQANAKQLEENAKHLKAIAAKAKVSGELTKKADDLAEDFIQRGGISDFNRNAVHKMFDGPKLVMQYGNLSELAEEKVKATKKVLEAQKKQIETLKKTAKDELQIEL